jgi:hypothetical protein
LPQKLEVNVASQAHFSFAKIRLDVCDHPDCCRGRGSYRSQVVGEKGAIHVWMGRELRKRNAGDRPVKTPRANRSSTDLDKPPPSGNQRWPRLRRRTARYSRRAGRPQRTAQRTSPAGERLSFSDSGLRFTEGTTPEWVTTAGVIAGHSGGQPVLSHHLA